MNNTEPKKNKIAEVLADKWSVEDYLDHTDYSDFNEYIPSAFALQFVTFIKLVNGEEGEENVTPVVHLKMLDTLVKTKANFREIINLCHRGMGKALALDEILYTPTGLTTIGDVQEGDYIYGEDGKLTKVTFKSEVFYKPTYKINLVDGRSLVVCEDHNNVVIHRRTVRHGDTKCTEYQRRTLTTKELLNYAITSTRKVTDNNPKGIEHNFWIPNCSPIEYPEKSLSIDPYTLGLLLGDGSMDRATGYARLHSHKDDYSFYQYHVPYSWGTVYEDKRNSNVVSVGIKGIGKLTKSLGVNVHGNSKFIPTEYLYGSVDQRLAILRGLMDTDGTVAPNGHGVSFCSRSKQLRNDVADLVRSLGGIATHLANDVVGIRMTINPFLLPRKASKFKATKLTKVAIESVEAIDIVPTQCIQVDNEQHTFVTTDYTVTHNTTLFAEYLILYLAIFKFLPNFGRIDVGIYVGDSMDNGVARLRKNIESRWDRSPFLQKYLPIKKFTEGRWEFTNNNGEKTIFLGYGVKTGVRGTKELGKRPNIAIMDDLISDEDANSPTIIKKVEDVINRAIDYALHPSQKMIIWSGTPFSQKDPLYKAVESGAWDVNVFPVCEKFPCTKAEFRGSWPDRFPYEYVRHQYDKAIKGNDVAGFYQELMLRVMSTEGRLLKRSDFRWFSREDVLRNPENYTWYITSDFATSEKQTADYNVLYVWAVNSQGWKFLMDGIVVRQNMAQTIEDLFGFAARYSVVGVGLEVTGQQGGFLSLIEREMVKRNIWFSLPSNQKNGQKGMRPTKDKFTRFQTTTVPAVKSGEIWLPIEDAEEFYVVELLNQVDYVTVDGIKSRKDDCIDGLTMINEIRLVKPYGGSSSMSSPTDTMGMPISGLSSYIV